MMKLCPIKKRGDVLNAQWKSVVQSKKKLVGFKILCLLFCFGSSVMTAVAQPSGGPYGPIRQTYRLLVGAAKIYYVAPDGQAEQTGESLTMPTTLEAAIERVRTGDAIIMRGEAYRTGNLILNQSVIMQPYLDEQPILKGT